MNTGTAVKLGIAGFGTFITQALGGWDMAIQLLIAAIVLDYLTGLLVAIKRKKISSKIGRDGLIKKIGYILAIIFCVLLDKMLNNSEPVVRTAIIYLFFANEGISILENLSNMGVWLPKWIKDVLIQVKGQMEPANIVAKKVK